MDDREIRRILTETHAIAVVGMSKDPAKDAHDIPLYLHSQGYRIFPVNPTASEIAGLIAHPKLSAVPVRIDLVQVFRPAAEAPAIVTDAARIGAKTVWLQTGLTSPEAREIAAKTGLRYVEDRCMRTEHRRLVAKGY